MNVQLIKLFPLILFLMYERNINNVSNPKLFITVQNIDQKE